MKRRAFLAEGCALTAGTLAFGVPAVDDLPAVKHLIAEYYDTFYRTRDRQRYRALLTRDYLLLENGEIFDAAGDIASMPAPGSGYRRTDAFDFRSVKVHGDTAYAVYFLTSEITDHDGGPRQYRWLESAILRRAATAWRVALLHSTRIAPAG